MSAVSMRTGSTSWNLTGSVLLENTSTFLPAPPTVYLDSVNMYVCVYLFIIYLSSGNLKLEINILSIVVDSSISINFVVSITIQLIPFCRIFITIGDNHNNFFRKAENREDNLNSIYETIYAVKEQGGECHVCDLREEPTIPEFL